MSSVLRRSAEVHGHSLRLTWDNVTREFCIFFDDDALFECSDGVFLGRFFPSLADDVFFLFVERLKRFYSRGGFCYDDIPESFRLAHWDDYLDCIPRTCRLWRSVRCSQKSGR